VSADGLWSAVVSKLSLINRMYGLQLKGADGVLNNGVLTIHCPSDNLATVAIKNSDEIKRITQELTGQEITVRIDGQGGRQGQGQGQTTQQVRGAEPQVQPQFNANTQPTFNAPPPAQVAAATPITRFLDRLRSDNIAVQLYR
jgi:hypothetical protein